MASASNPARNICAAKLAEGRRRRGLTQTALAREIGVSRQFLNQVESGRVLPNVVVALRLAASLDRSVEELFGSPAPLAANFVSVTAAGAPLPAGTRVRLGRVGKAWIAHSADTAATLAAGFANADAVLEADGRARLLRPPDTVASNLLVAGCDPALALLQPEAASGATGRAHWIDCGSGRALDLLAAGHVHVAGIHFAGHEGLGNIDELKRRDPKRHWRLVRFTRWDQGWILRRGAGPEFAGIRSLRGRKWRLANREESTAARRWLDRELAAAGIEPKKVPGYATPIGSAAEGVRQVLHNLADVTVGPRALALAHGSDFVAAEAVDFDLVAPDAWWRSAAGRELIKRIIELADTRVLASLPGYAPTLSGMERPRAGRRSE